MEEVRVSAIKVFNMAEISNWHKQLRFSTQPKQVTGRAHEHGK
jgi:hypothetical protein